MPKRVLIVDDAVFMRNMIRDIFSSGGYEVVGEAAHGIEATREIVRHDGRAVIVMCSALGQESLVMEAIEAGASDFIVKPFKSEDVLSVVKKVLGES